MVLFLKLIKHGDYDCNATTATKSLNLKRLVIGLRMKEVSSMKSQELKRQIEALLYAHRKCDFEFTLGYETACKDALSLLKEMK